MSVINGQRYKYKMNSLLQLLEFIDRSDLPESESCILNDIKDGDITVAIANATRNADDVLIDDNGRNIREHHDILINNGYAVFCGERDRFGWLSGCIQTKKGTIVYG